MDIPGQIILCVLVILMSILDMDLTDISLGDQGKEHCCQLFFWIQQILELLWIYYQA